jgi:protein SCO1/2
MVCLLACSTWTWSARDIQAQASVDARALTLIDQDGKPTSLHAFEGRTVVLHFIFTHCLAACHLQVKSLRAVRETFPADLRSRIQFVSVSLDPEHDTPDVLRQYAVANGIADADWRFVTASPDVIERLTRLFSVRREPVADGQINHTLAVFLFDASGRLIQRYADPVDPARLAREISAVDRLSGTQPSHSH